MAISDYLDKFGNYLVQSEIDAGVRDPETKDFYDPVTGAQTGIFGPDVSSKSVLDDFASAKTLKDKKNPADFPGYSGFVSAPAVPEYINADLAKAYGMDVATAYQEALANTAHQREIRDLQAAGLNPVLATRYGGSAGVSGASVMQSASSGPGRSSSEDSLSPLKILGTVAILSGLVAGIASKNPKVGAGVTSAVSAIDRLLN